jgi:hypothetical protein
MPGRLFVGSAILAGRVTISKWRNLAALGGNAALLDQSSQGRVANPVVAHEK